MLSTFRTLRVADGSVTVCTGVGALAPHGFADRS
jgi:hypothetical protein